MTTRSAEKRASNRKRVAEAEPTPPPSSRKASASKKKKPATSPAPALAPDSPAEDPRSEEELEVEDTECEALIEEPVATKRKAVSNKKAGGEDSECSFVGDPFPLDEAKKRWPERYSKPSGNRSSNTANNGKDDDEMKARLHYRKARVDGCMYDLFDDAYVKASEGEDDFIGRIVELFEGTDRKMYFTAQWFFRAQDTVIKDHADLHDARRVFLSEEKNDNSLDCIVSKINIVRVAPNIDLVAKEKKIPPCDLYYDMSYSLSYSTFANLPEENVAAGSETSSTISSDDTNNVSKEKSQYSQEVTSSGQKTNLALLDIYSGCGAMSTGLCLGANMINLNLETRWAVDINKSACESLRLNHPGTEVRNEQAENFLQLIKEWEKLCRKFSLTGKDSTIGQGIQYGGSDAEDEEPEDSNVPKGEFEVGKLLGICYGDPCKIGTVGLKFKVRWKGYGPSEDTWEPIDGLSKCQQKIEEFVRDGYKRNILPLPGTVDVICGGPPCQGISGFNRFRNTENPLKDPKNQQMVVFAEIVEFLKPKYVLMENVVDILKFAKGFLGRYALSRLVAMNYQVRLGIMAAGCYGLPQFRMRCFLWGAQPNEKLPQFPLPTHDVVVRGGAPNEFEQNIVAYDENQRRNLEKALVLGDAISDLPPVANNENRDEMPYGRPPKTEFQRFIRLTHESLNSSIAGEKSLHKGKLFDHMPLNLNQDDYERVSRIPKKKGANFRDLPGVMVGPDNIVQWDPSIERVLLPSGKPLVPDYAMSFIRGKSLKPFARLWWDQTVPTVVTRAEPHNQAIIHPEQDRVLTIRENARLQGFPDYYKLCGVVKERYIQVGNAVAVPVSRALGYGLALAFRAQGNDRPLFTLPPKFPRHKLERAPSAASEADEAVE